MNATHSFFSAPRPLGTWYRSVYDRAMRSVPAARLLLLTLAAIVAWAAPPAGAAPTSSAALAEPLWACHPDRVPNPCQSEDPLATTVLASTTLEPRKVARVERPPLDADRSIDCFYVYPTVVTSLRPTAPLAVTSEVQAILKYQAARFSQVCRVWAPVYRQATLGGIAGSLFAGEDRPPTDETSPFATGYRDVKAAWEAYLRSPARGRGVVLIGHSQGSGLLLRLMREVIERDPAQRALLVSAIVPGGNLVVPRGERVGGDLSQIPTCAAADETGCVLAWSTFATPPSRTALFGRPSGSLRRATGLPDVGNGEVACTNPAELSGDGGRMASITRSEQFPGLIGVSLGLMFYGFVPRASTPWVIPGERFRSSCVRWRGAHVLRVRPATPLSTVPFEAPYPDWGLHLADLNLSLGNLITIVRAQRGAWLATHPAAAAP